ncbi:MAG: hypothetical protein D6160_06500 [Ketobacter sp.]|nr:MAG: hypothetical protein D6160_06500 [Ketobacter sp.]
MLVALSTALLPWAGCHYVREMEDALRQNQAAALLAESRLLSRIVAQHEFPPQLASSDAQQPVFYTPRRYQPVQLDGYDDDWRGHAKERLPFVAAGSAASVLLHKALHQNALYVLLQVKHSPIHYHNPGFAFTYSDHVRLRSQGGGDRLEWVFFTSGPGQLQGYQWLEESKQLRPAPGFNAWWQETGDGFTLELVAPQNSLLDSVDISLYQVPDAPSPTPASSSTLYDPMEDEFYGEPRPQRARPVAGTRQPGQPPSRWLQPLPMLTSDLSELRTDQRDAVFISPRGWPLSEQRDLLDETLEVSEPSDTNSLLQAAIARFYRMLIDVLTPQGSQNPWPLSTTQLSSAQSRIDPNTLFASAQSIDRANAGWYQLQSNRQSALLTSQPVWQNGKLQGYLLLSQTSDALISLTNHALRKVTHLTLAVLVLVIGILVLFASSLSWRIRRLKRNAESAISQEGKIHTFRASSRRDEIGDLSRSYQALLHRVHGYTEYLETLNGKLAHELRTPLAIVKSSLEMLHHNNGDEQYLKRAEEGAERLRLILSAMSEASRVEQTIQQSEQQQFDLSALLSELTEAYRHTFPGHQYRYLAAAGTTPASGRPELIAQMVDKLIENARSFADPGSDIEIQLLTEPLQHQIRIINRGPLLPAKLQGQLFDSLVSERSVKPTGGAPHLGLGLYIVRLIAQAHQGFVQADNLPAGDGVVFSITLPHSS